jgi:peptide deformylase
VPYLREIITDGHPTLRKVAKKVGADELRDPLFGQLIDDMFETMYEAPGIGLAAPQINVSKRLFVVDLDEERGEHGPLVFVNPRFTETEGEVESIEGCLSVPGMIGDLTRHARVVCSALDREGKRFSVEGTGLFARCLQHEMDHLDGILMIDRISRAERKEAMRAMREAQQEANKPGSGADRAAPDAGEAASDAGKTAPDAGEAVPDASLA